MDEVMKDERFKHIMKDPKFRRIPRAERKVKIDKRFQGMFKDKKFTVHYTVDKRGRPVNQNSTENLRKYYELSSEDESDDDTEVSEKPKPDSQTSKSKKTDKKAKKKTKEPDTIDDNVEDEEEHVDENQDEDSSDNEFSSNGELLRIKPQADDQSRSGSESESDSDSQEDNKDATKHSQENENQLCVRKKNESNKLPEKVKEKLKDLSVNYARGEGVLLTDSSSDEESSEASDEEEEVEHDWGELDKAAETTDEISRRLAVCNMDWDRIRAVDLMVLFNSFLPSGGFIRSVSIYPSEFGLQRMKEEEVSGPIELTQSKTRDEDDNIEANEEGSQYHMEKLRQYQLNRLKYYYAVVEFDSAETANKVYTECDGIEYESTATKIDLRFIPDEMCFDQEPKEVCTETPELSKYQPRQFTTTALQQVKVELTWDETNPERQEIAQKINSGKLDEIKESELQAYLASDTSEEESGSDKEEETVEKENSDSAEETKSNPIEKYKALLKEIEEKEEAKQKKDVELEFTWGLGVKEKTEKLMKERLKKDESLTPFEQYLEKRKAKKKAKKEERQKLHGGKDAGSDSEVSDLCDDDGDAGDGKKGGAKSRAKKKTSVSDDSSDDEDEERRQAELELLLMDENGGDNKQHFNMKKIEENATMSKSKQKRLSKKRNADNDVKADDFEVDVKDPRFGALFTSHHFNIDPADPHYRKTKGTEALISEKLKRRVNDDGIEEVKVKQPKTDKKLNVELQALVKSVKKNTQNIRKPIK